MGLKWAFHFLFLLNFPWFLHALYGDYPTANLSSSWASNEEEFSIIFDDGSVLKPVLINNSSVPTMGCGFFGNSTPGYLFFVVFAIGVSSEYSISSIGNISKIVWSANRANPVRENATLQLTSDGDLVLREANGTLVWSTNTSGKSVVGMNITSTGNLMLYDSNNSIVWQSFDNPTDAWLPGQKLTLGQQSLVASISASNWTPGPFYFSCNSDGLYAYIDANPPQIYSKQVFYGDTETVQRFKTGRLDLLKGEEGNPIAVLYVSETKYFQYMRLDSDGHLRVYQWVEGNENVADDILKFSLDDCGSPTVCGNYGICSLNGQCSCPAGDDGDPSYFRQVSFRQPSLGCLETNQLSCQSPHLHLLLELDDVSYFSFVTVLANSDIKSCKEACLKNCSCKAAVFRYNLNFSSGNCSLPSRVFSLTTNKQSVVHYNSSVFIKVQKPAVEPSPNSSTRPDTKKPNRILIIGISLAVLLLFTPLIIWIYVRINWKRTMEEDVEEGENSLELLPDLPKRFSYEDLKSATENFHFSRKLGGGGFGSVFEGTLGDKSRIAVKRLERLGQGKKEFLAEVRTIGSIHHVKLVRLMGFCAEKLHRLLVYEYMSNGSLDKWIFHRNPESTLGWDIKKKIILSIAKGLAYLHEDCQKRIAHLDIKPQNILIDDNFNAKLSDFGLAKLMDKDQSHVMTQMKGTRGYMAPEWLSRKITEKVDVYSFGVVILEVVCGRKNLDYSQPEENDYQLLHIVKEKAEANQLFDLIDKCSEDMQRYGEEAVEMIRIAIWCLHNDPTRRPSMSTVVKVLEGDMAVEPISDYSFLAPTMMETPTEEVVTVASSALPASILSGPR